MEKIYMENNNKDRKQSFFQRLFQSNKSVVASFIVALVAVGALILVGFNQISYAINTVEDPLPDSFTTATLQTNIIGSAGSGSTFAIWAYETSDGIPVFCLQHNTSFCENRPYSKGETISDPGLIYLMANLYNGTEASRIVKSGSVEVDIWLTQTAIWVYQKLIGDATANLTDEQLQTIYAVSSMYTGSAVDLNVGNVTGPLYDAYQIKGIIQEAINIHNGKKDLQTFTMYKESDSLKITDDEKYYTTDLISVIGSVANSNLGSFDGYSLKISNAPEGTIIVNQNGEKITDLENMAVGTQFFVRVPVDKVTEENKQVTLTADGKFKAYEGNIYQGGTNRDGSPCQTITNVRTVSKVISDGLTFDINYTPDVPDTGMNAAQSIYFIGLIILLSGVGIIYANVKPAENK